jgi:hypothetical protein
MNSTVVLGLVGSTITLVLLLEMLRRRKLREKYAVFWAVVALATVIVALFPGLLAWSAQQVGVAVPSNLLFFVASMVLLVVSVQHSSELGQLEERSRTLAEEVGLLRMRLSALEAEQSSVERESEPDTSQP